MKKTYRYYQSEADACICKELEENDKCLVKMFCGTGKSLIMKELQLLKDKTFYAYVFPSLSLIEQFCCDYLKHKKYLKISSDDKSTTDLNTIENYLKNKKQKCKIICITYQSFHLIVNLLEKLSLKLQVCIFDEAHHAVGETYQRLIFENDVCEKQIFFTATPKNANGIVMLDRYYTEKNMCGKLVYDYSYLKGVNEEYLNPFEIRIDMYIENTNKSVYESIVRAIFTSGNNRVLTFHSDVNTERDTSVYNFVNESLLRETFKYVMEQEFPEKQNHYTNISIVALGSSISMMERKQILQTFDETSDNDIMILSSCETIGEGIDTKNANMCVFVDPKTSYVKIIQNIGRIVRKEFGKNKPNSTILIPCWVDKTKYLECNGDREKCDEVIRQDMNVDGNYNGILNVMSALKQEDEDIYDICLHYPDSYSPQEIEANLSKHGFKVEDPVGEGELIENLEYLLDIEIDRENYEDCETDEEIILCLAEDEDVCIEIHSTSLEEPIERYNPDCEDVIRLYREDNDEECTIYRPIVKKVGEKKTNSGEKITEPKRENRFKIQVHTSPDVQILWNIVGDVDMTKEICSCILDCEVVDYWVERLEETKKFMDENKRRPNSNLKNEEGKLGQWLQHQITNYKKKTEGMKDPERYKIWTQFLEEYKEYLKNNDEIWFETFEELKKFIDENKIRPSSRTKIGNWLSNQNKNYKKKTEGMKDPERYKIWTQFLEEYKEYLKNNDEIWFETFEELKKFIDENKRRPNRQNRHFKNEEGNLGQWLSFQIKKYKKKLHCMKDPERYKIWTQFLEDYKKYLKNNDEIWFETFEKLKKFIDENKRRPNSNLKNEEGILGDWLQNQIQNYKKKLQCMKDPERYKIWTQFLEEYKEYFKSDHEKWFETFEKLKKFIDENKRRPNHHFKNEEGILGDWLSCQIQNYKKKTKGIKDPERYKIWTQFLEDYKEYFKNDHENWFENFEKLKKFIDENKRRPSSRIEVGRWLCTQIQNYKKKLHCMKDPERYKIWTQFLEDYKGYFNNNNTSSITIESIKSNTESIKSNTESIKSNTESTTSTEQKPKKSMKLPNSKIILQETTEQKHQRVHSELSELHKKYKTMNSKNLHQVFQENPEDWYNYHKISEENEESFPTKEIPRNRIIEELNKIKTKRTKKVVDMGCGKAQIAEHFDNDSKYNFINYDHIKSNEIITCCDISQTPEEDDSVEICILSLAMWGSNCKEYIQEAYRILESNGTLFIIEPTKRWSEKDEQQNIISGTEACRLKNLLEENNFQILNQSIEKFSFFTCRKI